MEGIRFAEGCSLAAEWEPPLMTLTGAILLDCSMPLPRRSAVRLPVMTLIGVLLVFVLAVWFAVRRQSGQVLD